MSKKDALQSGVNSRKKPNLTVVAVVFYTCDNLNITSTIILILKFVKSM